MGSPAESIVIKVAPPNPYRSRFPRITHKIALAGGGDFQKARVAFGLQVRPADSKYPAIRVNTEWWRLQYTLKVNHQPVATREFKDASGHLSEELAAWQSGDEHQRRVAVARLSLVAGRSLSDALRDIAANGHRYAFECTMATAIVRLFVVRRGVISTKARFEEKHEADGYFDMLHPAVKVEPLEGNIEVPGLKWPSSALPIHLGKLRGGGEVFTADGGKKLRPGDWIYFTHPFFSGDDPFFGENALWLGNGMIYAHDYGMVSMDRYLAEVHQHDPSIALSRVRRETTVSLQLEGE
jgi:hypothetical protein